MLTYIKGDDMMFTYVLVEDIFNEMIDDVLYIKLSTYSNNKFLKNN